jgi:hypothetical protein
VHAEGRDIFGGANEFHKKRKQGLPGEPVDMQRGWVGAWRVPYQVTQKNGGDNKRPQARGYNNELRRSWWLMHRRQDRQRFLELNKPKLTPNPRPSRANTPNAAPAGGTTAPCPVTSLGKSLGGQFKYPGEANRERPFARVNSLRQLG